VFVDGRPSSLSTCATAPLAPSAGGDVRILRTVHWGRVLLGGVAVETILFAMALPMLLSDAQFYFFWILIYAIPPASFLAAMGVAYFQGRTLVAHHVLHGALVGVVATALYVGLTRAEKEPPPYLLAHALKMVGGMIGGALAA
jgi:hypothetical protein